MTISADAKNAVKEQVLYSLESMFTSLTEKYNSEENHDLVLYLLDVENKIKESLMDPDLS